MTNESLISQAPRGPFETQLFRREIERQFVWSHNGVPLRIDIGPLDHGTGRFTVTLMLEPQSFDIRRYTQDNLRVVGTCWLTENRHGEPVARWDLPVQPMVEQAQNNDAQHPPVVTWE